MNQRDQEKLTDRLVDQIVSMLNDDANSNTDGALYEVQPTSRIVRLAAQAATAVLVAFEIAYQIVSSEEQQA